MSDRHTYDRWQRQHPGFDWKAYCNWVKSRGYYRYALDTARPEFYEYASVYLRVSQARSGQWASS